MSGMFACVGTDLSDQRDLKDSQEPGRPSIGPCHMAAAIAVSKTLKPPPPVTGKLAGFVSVSPSAVDASLTLVLSSWSLFLRYSLGWLVAVPVSHTGRQR